MNLIKFLNDLDRQLNAFIRSLIEPPKASKEQKTEDEEPELTGYRKILGEKKWRK